MDEVAVVVVGVTDRNNTLISYRDENDLGDWMVFVESTDEMIREYAIRQQATKLAIGRDGVIIERKPFGSNPEAYWRGILEQLLASPEAAAQAPAEPEPTAVPIVAAQPATATAGPSTAEPANAATAAPAAPEPTATAPAATARPTMPPTAEPTDTPAPIVAQGWRTRPCGGRQHRRGRARYNANAGERRDDLPAAGCRRQAGARLLLRELVTDLPRRGSDAQQRIRASSR